MDPDLIDDTIAEFTGALRIQAFGTVTYPDGTVPTDPDYQPPAE